jgi:hypothetical protein
MQTYRFCRAMQSPFSTNENRYFGSRDHIRRNRCADQIETNGHSYHQGNLPSLDALSGSSLKNSEEVSINFSENV